MARAQKGSPFQKGVSGNPAGRPKSDLPQARKMSATLFSHIVMKYMDFTLEDIQRAFKDKQTQALDLIVLKILHEGIKRGDQSRLNFLLDRTVGKVSDKIDISSSDGSMSPHRGMSDEELQKRIQAAKDKLQTALNEQG